jgi:shikimate kinase
MAAGKSTIGKRLARKLGVPFYDIDDLIAARHGPIDEIFRTRGEAVFREHERAVIAHVLTDCVPGVIALGGGAVMHDATLGLLEQHAYRVFLNVSPEQIVGRLRRSKRIRPLLGPAPKLRTVKALYAERFARYARADFVVETHKVTGAAVVEEIVQWCERENVHP